MTLDDDVAAQLERLRKRRDSSLKEVVNEALRKGLREMTEKPKRREPFRTRAFDLGRPLIPLDNIAEALAIAEGEDYK